MHKGTIWTIIIDLTLPIGLAAQPAPNQSEHEAFALRDRIIQAALAQKGLFDCETYSPPTDPILPVEQTIFRIVQNRKITLDDGREYLGAVWSPDGQALVFVTPTGDYRTIPNDDTLPSDDQTRLVAISKNALLLYFLERNDWKTVTTDGIHPVWSFMKPTKKATSKTPRPTNGCPAGTQRR